jgi:anthranilate phosphoribosyltransferase
MSRMVQDALKKVVEGRDLTEAEATAAMDEITEGDASPALVGALLTGLRMKGETSEEITGFARVMRAKAIRIPAARSGLVDTCGTGGGGLATFNISTTAAFVVAGAGVTVAKHGNRGMTSTCGSADVLEALGVCITCPPAQVGECLDQAGIGFMFAQAHHPALKHAAPVRRELGFRTILNLVAPLTNPAGATAQVIGVFDPRSTELLALALRNLGSRRAFVVHGLDGLDELSTLGITRVTELRDGSIRTYELTPEEVGLPPAMPEDLRPDSDLSRNADLVRGVLAGHPGPRRDIVLLNAAAALVAGGAAHSLIEGIQLAAASIDSGAAAERMERMKEISHAS